MWKSWPIKSLGAKHTSDQSWIPLFWHTTSLITNTNTLLQYYCLFCSWFSLTLRNVPDSVPVHPSRKYEQTHRLLGRDARARWPGLSPAFLHDPSWPATCICGRNTSPSRQILENIYPTRKPEKIIPIGQLRWQVSQLQLCPLFALLAFFFFKSPTDGLDGMKFHKPSAVGESSPVMISILVGFSVSGAEQL